MSVVRDLVRVMRPLVAKRQTTPRRLPSTSVATIGTNGGGGRQATEGKDNVKLFRHWSEHSEWVRAAINIRKRQLAQAEWDIVPIDHTKPFDERLQADLRNMFRRPNPKDKKWKEWIEQIVEDMMVLDAGCIEKELDIVGRPVQLWPVDGGTIQVSKVWDGDPNEPRYFWKPDHQVRAKLMDREMVYILDNPRTYSVVGLSPLETLKMTIDSELGLASYNDRQMRAPTPDGMLDLGENARPDQIEGFKNFWRAEVAGQGALAIIGGTKNARFTNFRQTNREGQFMEYNEWLVRKIAAVFSLTPMDLMIERDVNRSTAEEQGQNSEDRGMKPLMGTVGGFLTSEIVWDEAFGGVENNLMFNFTAVSQRESLSRAQINRYSTGNLSWKTPNEARKDDGRPPLGDPNDPNNPANQLIVNTSKGLARVEDVPTARELMDSGKGAPPPGGGTKLFDPFDIPTTEEIMDDGS